ncbi:MAG: DUF6465 family protein [Fusicatenibacter sp.]|nr:DUF6465 family protein [Fusicatenibacter sp.]
MSNRRIAKKRKAVLEKERMIPAIENEALAVMPKVETKKVMRNFFVQYQDREILESEVMSSVARAWKESGKKEEDIEKLDVYFKPEENRAYYVVNDGQENGCLEF